jgi:hypothetical protein
MSQPHPCTDKLADMKSKIKNEWCVANPLVREPTPETCKITEQMIQNITRFLCSVIPNTSKDPITLDDIKKGSILNRGSFGYTYELGNNKNIIIKIIVCNDQKYMKKLEEEIEIHKIISKYDPENYISLYGYYKKLGDKYKYVHIYNNTETSHEINFTNYNPEYYNLSCEIYLLLEKAIADVTKYIGRVFDDISDAQSIFDLLNSVRISQKMLKDEKKIFIHSDIKAENVVRSYNSITSKYNLKLIDFGLSILSTDFFVNSSDGTESIFKLLFSHQVKDQSGNIISDIYDRRLAMISPLFDIFSIILVMFELFIQRRINLSENNIYFINENMVEYIIKNPSLTKYIRRLLIIFNNIYDYHQKKIQKYYTDVLTSDTSIFSFFRSRSNPLDNYIQSYNMENFILSDIVQSELTPKYIHSGNKLKDDVDYLINIIDYVLALDF